MAGLCYFRGEGVPMDRAKAREYFTQLTNDESEGQADQHAEFMLLVMKYF